MAGSEEILRLSRRAGGGDLLAAKALVALLEAGGGQEVERSGSVPASAKVLAEAAADGDLSAAEALVLVLKEGATRGPRLVAQFPTRGGRMTAPGALVLREIRRGSDDSEWAVHWRNDQDGGLYEGSYFPGSLRDAALKFAERITTYAQRYLA